VNRHDADIPKLKGAEIRLYILQEFQLYMWE
jgi:hypothetical protein